MCLCVWVNGTATVRSIGASKTVVNHYKSIRLLPFPHLKRTKNCEEKKKFTMIRTASGSLEHANRAPNSL